ncbi:hypothetical protein [Phyllobacterium sophorae]|uniref:Uncharacterized protein n=1 Tax=Phyllobacterium sophorae TaxID=1520277 RepID=A0A2P7BDY9_9HYPH|nr:hypothetical protein [Phyllobacterium sophorae]PSH64672.1 hypothetical protein CU103_12375 [Phyllobacterium sophorae]
MAFEIINGLEMPDRTSSRESIYPFGVMQVGHAFKFSPEELKRVTAAVGAYRKKDKEKSFAIRKIDDETYGCWRIEPPAA